VNDSIAIQAKSAAARLLMKELLVNLLPRRFQFPVIGSERGRRQSRRIEQIASLGIDIPGIANRYGVRHG
jgi:hypothetical protein